jgi:Holliday junction resolvase RusA-like endonuclease
MSNKPYCKRFFIAGRPEGLKRHRTYRLRSGANVNVDPSSAAKCDFLTLAHQNSPESPITRAVSVTLEFVFPRPKAHFDSKGRIKERMYQARYTKKPDVDNLVKFVCDSLNGVYWHDDSLIYHVTASKRYVNENEPCGTHLSIQEMEE